MNKNIVSELYMNLSKSGLEDTKKEAEEEAMQTYGEEEGGKNELLYPTLRYAIDELYFDRDSEKISVTGEFFNGSIKLGFLSYELNVSSELLIEIIEHYMKKLGKLKTVMEAIK